MQKTYALPLLIASALVLISCNDPKKANETNFKAAAQEYINTKYPFCYLLTGNALPFEISTGEASTSAIGYFHELANAKLITETEVSRKQLKFGSNDIETIKYRYELTPEGQKFYKAGKNTGPIVGSNRGFCFGRATVDKIENFTVPSDAMGNKMAKVVFTYSVSGIPDWAKNPELVKYSSQLQRDLASNEKPVKNSGTYLLTDKGWVHQELVNQ